MTDANFRNWTRRVVLVVGAVYLCQWFVGAGEVTGRFDERNLPLLRAQGRSQPSPRCSPTHAPAQRPLAVARCRLRVCLFAVTANNVTCALWRQAQASGTCFRSAGPTWGCIPGWGFGEVVESRCDRITVGEQRLFGFLPMGSYLVCGPARFRRRAFDATPERADAAPILHYFLRRGQSQQAEPMDDRLFALLYPLFGVGYLLADYVATGGATGSGPLLITAASSKTAACAAFCLRRALPAADLWGLTSPSHLDFVKSLGCYDRVMAYGQASVGLRREEVTLIDVAGDARLRDALHQHYGDRLRRSISVGRAHWAEFKPRTRACRGLDQKFWAPHYGSVRVSSAPGGLSSEQYNAGLYRAWRDFVSAVLCRPHHPPFGSGHAVGAGRYRRGVGSTARRQRQAHEGFVVTSLGTVCPA